MTTSQYPLFPGVGIPTFLRSPMVETLSALDADIAVLGVPTTKARPTSPAHVSGPVLSASTRCASEPAARVSTIPRAAGRISSESNASGGLWTPATHQSCRQTVESTFAVITETVETIVSQGVLPVMLGGDHAIPYPIVRAFNEPLYVFQFDAHLDYEPFAHGLEMTNGHAFRQSLTCLTFSGSHRSGFEASVTRGARSRSRSQTATA